MEELRVSVLTVGDELLAGDIDNTNATWLATQLTQQGATVREIVVLPDEVQRVQEAVADHSNRFDAVVLTGGLGSTPDDVTVQAVSAGLGRETVHDEPTYNLVSEEVETIREEYPEFEFDLEAGSKRPAGSTPIENENGIAPGFVVENVFVLPGIPSEMKPMFGRVAEDLRGSLHSRSVLSTEAESHLNDLLNRVDEEFDVFVGCYPDNDEVFKRIKIRGTDPESVENAYSWLLDRPEIDGPLDGGD